MKRLASFVAVLLTALCFTAVAWAVDPPDDGQNPPSPTPGMFVNEPEPQIPGGPEIWCGVNVYNPWLRHYVPWDVWYVQARVQAYCKEKIGGIWFPFDPGAIGLTVALYKAPPGEGYSQVDVDQDIVFNDAIASARNVYICDGKTRDTLYLMQYEVAFYGTGNWGGDERIISGATGGFEITCT